VEQWGIHTRVPPYGCGTVVYTHQGASQREKGVKYPPGCLQEREEKRLIPTRVPPRERGIMRRIEPSPLPTRFTVGLGMSLLPPSTRFTVGLGMGLSSDPFHCWVRYGGYLVYPPWYAHPSHPGYIRLPPTSLCTRPPSAVSVTKKVLVGGCSFITVVEHRRVMQAGSGPFSPQK